MSEQATYERGEITRRGNELFEREIRQQLSPDIEPRAFVAIDVETGDYEVDEREVEAVNRLTERRPQARGRICLRRAASESTYRVSSRFQVEGSRGVP